MVDVRRSGSVPLTNWSGSERPKTFRIRNTCLWIYPGYLLLCMVMNSLISAIKIMLITSIYSTYRTVSLQDRLWRIFTITEVMLLYNFVPNCRNESVVLSEFGKLDTARFCLAHLYTNRWLGTNVVDPWHFDTDMEIRTRESVPLAYGSESCFFSQWLTRCQVFLLVISSQGFSYIFLLVNGRIRIRISTKEWRIREAKKQTYPQHWITWAQLNGLCSRHSILSQNCRTSKQRFVNLIEHLAKRFHNYNFFRRTVLSFLVGALFSTQIKRSTNLNSSTLIGFNSKWKPSYAIGPL